MRGHIGNYSGPASAFPQRRNVFVGGYSIRISRPACEGNECVLFDVCIGEGFMYLVRSRKGTFH